MSLLRAALPRPLASVARAPRALRRLLRTGTAIALVVGGPAAGVGAADSSARPAKLAKGTYCPIPQPGTTPRCLGAAQAEYGDFFAALGRGALDAEASARVEADLRSDERAHLALSSLAFGYFELATQAAAEPDSNPDLVARLRRWNRLLAETYEAAEPLRGALREAAADIEARSPRLSLACDEAEGDCGAFPSLTSAFAQVDAAAGVRGPLVRLWERWMGAGSEDE